MVSLTLYVCAPLPSKKGRNHLSSSRLRKYWVRIPSVMQKAMWAAKVNRKSCGQANLDPKAPTIGAIGGSVIMPNSITSAKLVAQPMADL